MPKFNDAEIDSILASVDQALEKAAALQKNSPMARPATTGQLPTQASAGGGPKTPSGASMAQPAGDPMKNKIAPEAPTSSGVDNAKAGQSAGTQPISKDDMDPNKKPTDDAPPMEANGGEGAGAPPAADPAAEGAGEPAAPGEQGLEAEQGGDQPLSDDELHEIYASMDPAELERHFMIIRSCLAGAYGEAEGGAPAPADAGGAPAPAEAPAPEASMKSEDAQRLSNLEKENAELKKSFEKAVKAMEVFFAPQRKAITDIAILGKNEGEGEVKELNDAQLKSVLAEKSKTTSLTKSERDAINDFYLTGGSKQAVIEIAKKR